MPMTTQQVHNGTGMCIHISVLFKELSLALWIKKGGFCKCWEYAGQPFCPASSLEASLGRGVPVIHRPGHTRAAVEASLLNASVAGPRWGLVVDTCFFLAQQAVASSSPAEFCLICQAQNGSLARDCRAGRAPGPILKEITWWGHRPDSGMVKGGKYFRPERKDPAHEMNHSG